MRLLQALHKIAAENYCCYCCWAFDTNRLEPLLPSSMAAMPDDVMHTPASHLSAWEIQLMLKINTKETQVTTNLVFVFESRAYLLDCRVQLLTNMKPMNSANWGSSHRSMTELDLDLGNRKMLRVAINCCC